MQTGVRAGVHAEGILSNEGLNEAAELSAGRPVRDLIFGCKIGNEKAKRDGETRGERKNRTKNRGEG